MELPKVVNMANIISSKEFENEDYEKLVVYFLVVEVSIDSSRAA